MVYSIHKGAALKPAQPKGNKMKTLSLKERLELLANGKKSAFTGFTQVTGYYKNAAPSDDVRVGDILALDGTLTFFPRPVDAGSPAADYRRDDAFARVLVAHMLTGRARNEAYYFFDAGSFWALANFGDFQRLIKEKGVVAEIEII